MRSSFANRLSRILLAVECVVILLPTVLIAALLFYLFVMYGLTVFFLVIMGDMGTHQITAFVSHLISVALLLTYLLTIVGVSIGYISHGRPSLDRVPRAQWLAIFLGMGVSPLWILASRQNWSETAGAFSVLILPSIPLTLIGIHLILAREIARYRKRHA